VVLSLFTVGLYAIVQSFGWRSYTSAFSGTLPAAGVEGEWLAQLGMLYAGLYFITILIAPIFAIAGVMRWLLQRWL